VDSSGKINAHDNVDDCSLCPILTYNPLVGLGEPCYPCLSAKTTGNVNCAGCDPGMYKLNEKDCQDCDRGMFSSKRNQNACTQCSKGQYADDVGTSTCKMCHRGKYGGTDGAITLGTCVDCHQGR
jgi:hypothetical protein